jgi:hypothetical protein
MISTASVDNGPIPSAEGRLGPLGYELVNCTVTCILTRFQIRSVFYLPYFYLAFRRIRKDCRGVIPGLLKTVFLFEGPRTYYVLSIWTDERAIVQFNGLVTSHISAANWAMVFTRNERGRPAIWSAQWRLWAVGSNLNWDGVNLRAVLAEHSGTHDQAAKVRSM